MVPSHLQDWITNVSKRQLMLADGFGRPNPSLAPNEEHARAASARFAEVAGQKVAREQASEELNEVLDIQMPDTVDELLERASRKTRARSGRSEARLSLLLAQAARVESALAQFNRASAIVLDGRHDVRQPPRMAMVVILCLGVAVATATVLSLVQEGLDPLPGWDFYGGVLVALVALLYHGAQVRPSADRADLSLSRAAPRRRFNRPIAIRVLATGVTTLLMVAAIVAALRLSNGMFYSAQQQEAMQPQLQVPQSTAPAPRRVSRAEVTSKSVHADRRRRARARARAREIQARAAQADARAAPNTGVTVLSATRPVPPRPKPAKPQTSVVSRVSLSPLRVSDTTGGTDAELAEFNGTTGGTEFYVDVDP